MKKTYVVCIHGLFGNLTNFTPLSIADHTQKFNWVIPDLPLYSKSEVKPTIKGLTDWLQDFLKQKNISSALFIGNSLGGQIAIELAIRSPESVEALVLTGSAGMGEIEFGGGIPPRNDRAFVARQAQKTFVNYRLTDEEIDDIFQTVQQKRLLLRMIRLAQSSKKYVIDKTFFKHHIPTLLIWGKQDQITPLSCAEAFKSVIPHAKLSILEQCGHVPMLEYPEKFLHIFDDFIKDHAFKQA